MLHILGIARAFPQNSLTTDTLIGLGVSNAARSDAESKVKSRYTCLSSEYLARTKNADPREALQGSAESASDLATRAARAAIEAAGITPEQITCIVGDNPTPAQTTPGEGQRVGDRLGLKVAAYDITGGGIIPLHLSLLSRWKPEKLADYTLLVAVAAPTLRTNYSVGNEGLVFGDAAVAMVVSAKHLGKFKVVDSFAKSVVPRRNTAHFDQFLSASIDLPEFTEQTEALTQEMVGQAIFRNKLKPHSLKFALSHLSPACTARMAAALSVPLSSVLDDSMTTGNILSVGASAALAGAAPTLKTGETVVCAQVSTGLTAGYAVVEVL